MQAAVLTQHYFNKLVGTDLGFGSLTPDLSHCVCMTTEAMYLCFCTHVPHLCKIKTYQLSMIIYMLKI